MWDQIGQDNLAIFRLCAGVLIAICAFQMLLLLSNYWHNVVPLRKEILDGEIVAPPVFWTLAYHSLVFGVLAVMSISYVQTSFRVGVPATLGTWAIPVLVVPLTVVISKFQTAYSKNLRRSIHQQALTGETCRDSPAGHEGVEGGTPPGRSGF